MDSSFYFFYVVYSEGEGEDIEIMKEQHKNVGKIDPELMLMKKDEYVEVIAGSSKGRYGILMGAKNGRLEVFLIVNVLIMFYVMICYFPQ